MYKRQTWDCLDGIEYPQAGQVISCSSSQQAGWGVAKGALIDNFDYYRPQGDWGVYAFGWMTDPTVNSVDNAVDEFVTLNMQKTYRIDQIFFAPMESWTDQGLPADFTISVSTDGENWVKVVEETGNSIAKVNENGLFVYPIHPIECQFVKMEITKVAGPVGDSVCVCLAELGVFETNRSLSQKESLVHLLDGYNGYDAFNMVEGGKPITEWDCLDGPTMPEAGQVITVSSSQHHGWGAAKGGLIDGHTHTDGSGSWGMGNAFSWFSTSTSSTSLDVDQFVILNLQKLYPVDKIFFGNMESWSNQGMPSDFTISVSRDGENWTEVVKETGLDYTDAEDVWSANNQAYVDSGVFERCV